MVSEKDTVSRKKLQVYKYYAKKKMVKGFKWDKLYNLTKLGFFVFVERGALLFSLRLISFLVLATIALSFQIETEKFKSCYQTNCDFFPS